jgi:hypothetical protein
MHVTFFLIVERSCAFLALIYTFSLSLSTFVGLIYSYLFISVVLSLPYRARKCPSPPPWSSSKHRLCLCHHIGWSAFHASSPPPSAGRASSPQLQPRLHLEDAPPSEIMASPHGASLWRSWWLHRYWPVSFVLLSLRRLFPRGHAHAWWAFREMSKVLNGHGRRKRIACGDTHVIFY